MAITRFEDLPSENSPINSENLNGNFDELGVKVGTSVDNNYRVNILFQGGNILPKGTIHNLTSGSVALNFKVPKANTQYTMKSNIPAGEGAVVFFGSGADATVTTSNNGVSSTTPRTMTSDSNGYVTIAFRYLSEEGSQRNLDLYWYTIAEGTTGVDYIGPSINVDGETIYAKGQVEEYSDAEQVIGTWMGKPLYRKVFTITSLTSSNANLVDVSGLSIDFAKISGTIITSTGAKFPINLYDSASNYSVIILSDSGYIRGRGAIGSGTLSKCIVILEYTKTTD
jgi:hypothetical protein